MLTYRDITDYCLINQEWEITVKMQMIYCLIGVYSESRCYISIVYEKIFFTVYSSGKQTLEQYSQRTTMK